LVYQRKIDGLVSNDQQLIKLGHSFYQNALDFDKHKVFSSLQHILSHVYTMISMPHQSLMGLIVGIGLNLPSSKSLDACI